MRRLDTTWLLRMLCTVAVVLFALQVFSHNKADVDLWGNVGFVTSLPWSDDYHYTNTFSFTEPAYRWINHEWLGEYILNRTFVHFGNPGLLALKLVLGFVLLALLLRPIRQQSKSGALHFFYLLLTLSTIGYGYSMRPHHFTYLMLALLLTLHLTRGGQALRPAIRVLLTFLIGLLWCNLHGAFFIGAILLAATAALTAARALRPARDPSAIPEVRTLLLCLVAFVAASLLNPYGLRLWEFVFESGARARTYLSEWAPFHPGRDFLDHVDFVFLAGLLLLACAAARSTGDTVNTGLLLLSLIAALALRRNIPLFAIVAAFTGVRCLDAAFGEKTTFLMTRFPRLLPLLFLAAFIPLSLRATLTFDKWQPLQIEIPRDEFPVETIAFLKENHIKGNALVFFNWAEQCIWHLYPDVKVFLDGRFRSAYSDRTTNDYLDFFYDGKRWDRALTDYATDIVLVHRTDLLYDRMTQRTGWTLVHQTPIAALFMKNSIHAHRFSELTEPAPVAVVAVFP